LLELPPVTIMSKSGFSREDMLLTVGAIRTGEGIADVSYSYTRPESKKYQLLET
jgi:hypothetical protein